MKKEITRLICAAICCAPIIGFAQTGDKFTSADNLYKEGKELFQEKNYAAALPALKAFVKQKPTASLLQDAEYMLVSISTIIPILLMPIVSTRYWLPATSTKENTMRLWHSSTLPTSIC